MQQEPKYKRIILKLSGEVLRNTEDGETLDADILTNICKEVKKVYDIGVEVGLVIGGGNIFRGLNGSEMRGIDRTTGDYMGMLATVINGLALMDRLEKLGVTVRLQSAIPMDKLAEPFILRRATRHLERGRVVIFAGGTGNPYFSTDTCAALRGTAHYSQRSCPFYGDPALYAPSPHTVPALSYLMGGSASHSARTLLFDRRQRLTQCPHSLLFECTRLNNERVHSVCYR